MTFTNLEKYVFSKKCLKQRRQFPPPPTPFLAPPSSKVEGILVPKKSLGYGPMKNEVSMGVAYSHEESEEQP